MSKEEIIDGQPPRSERMTGLAQWQVMELAADVFGLLDTASAMHIAHVAAQAQPSAVLVDGFIAPTGERAAHNSLREVRPW